MPTVKQAEVGGLIKIAHFGRMLGYIANRLGATFSFFNGECKRS